MFSIRVTNQPPATDNKVHQGILSLFEQYNLAQYGQTFAPFAHQAEMFRHLLADEEVFLVAGTAAGKTLAVAVPLFHKLAARRIRKILFLYPTIALMEDQRRVMDGLAALTGLEIGVIRGGMSRAELIEALNKPVMLATPDAVYWFFRKNVKYSRLLIYGLLLLDEAVIDEAHLFNGIMLQNLFRLRQRIQLLSERIGKRPRWHILTATPTPELRLLTGGDEVTGRSKCGDVAVTFHAPALPSGMGNRYEGRAQRMIAAVDEVLTGGSQKVLVVSNAADFAHRLFAQVRGSQRPLLSIDLLWNFGRVRWGELERWLAREGTPIETTAEISMWLRQQSPLYLKEVLAGRQASPAAETLMRCLALLLEEYQRSFRRLVTLASKDERRGLRESLEARLKTSSKASRLLWDVIATVVPARAEQSAITGILDTWIGTTLAALERALTGETFSVTAPHFPEITALLRNAGVGNALAQFLTNALPSLVTLSEQDTEMLDPSASSRTDQLVAFSALSQVVQDQSRYIALAQRIRSALMEGQLNVESRHIATWKNTGIPIVLYTGKMARAERDGLIDAFAQLPQAVLISTPAVEVGVDFAADMLVTEECDGNAFLQRFGRVGRRAGIQGSVVVFLKSGETYAKLASYSQQSVPRAVFSDLIAHPATGVFPRRIFTGHSLYVDLTHWLVNRELGEVGGWLNRLMFGQDVAQLAGQLQAAGVAFSYGLRATLPTISLKYGAGSADPFYLLRVVENEDLILSDSPFELARSDISYEEFLWKKPFWKAITVDIKATLEDSQALFWWRDGGWHLQSGYGIAADYTRLLDPIAVKGGKSLKELLAPLEQRIKRDPQSTLSSLRSHYPSSPLVRVGEALPLLFEPHAQFVLGQGSIHLLRLDKDGVTIPVEDRLGNPLILPEQMWLLLYGYERERVWPLLQSVSAEKLEEVIYDLWSLERHNGKLLFLLDRAGGACFALYQKLVNYGTVGSL